MRYLTAIVTLFVLTLGSRPAFAQDRAVSPDSLRPPRIGMTSGVSPEVLHAATKNLGTDPRGLQKPDSVKNGAIIGAVVGGAAMAGFMTFLIHGVGCVAEDTPCGREVMIASLMTAGAAGAGALIGAGIDKAVHDQRHTTLPANRVVPVLSPRRAGVFMAFRW